MSRKIACSALVLGILLAASTPAHAGWLMDKAQKAAKKLVRQNRSSQRDERDVRREQEERNASRQRVMKQVVKTNGSPVQPGRVNGLGNVSRQTTLAERLGGSQRDPNRVSSLHQMLVRNGGGHGGPDFTFRSTTAFHPVFRNSSTNGAGTSLFSFSL